MDAQGRALLGVPRHKSLETVSFYPSYVVPGMLLRDSYVCVRLHFCALVVYMWVVSADEKSTMFFCSQRRIRGQLARVQWTVLIRFCFWCLSLLGLTLPSILALISSHLTDL